MNYLYRLGTPSLPSRSRAAPPRKESMPSFISPLTRDEEGERERTTATAVAVAARAKTFFYLTLPPPTNDDDAPIFVHMQVLSLSTTRS